MSNKQLILYIGTGVPDNEASPDYQLLLAEKRSNGSVDVARLESDGLPVADIDSATVIVSAQYISTFVVEIPPKQKKYLSKTLPFMLEDELIEPIERLHIAWQELSNSTVRAVVVSRKLMGEIKQCCEQYDVQFDRLLVDADLLAENGVQRIATVGESLLIKDIQSNLAYLDKTASVQSIEVGDAGAVGQDVQPEIVGSQESLLELISDQLFAEKNTAVNLWQGAFSVSSSESSYRQIFTTVGLAASVFLVLQIAYWLIAANIYSSKANGLEVEAEALYRSYFPSDKVVIDIRRQAEGHLENSGSYQEKDQFLSLLNHLGSAIDALSQVETLTKFIRYEQSSEEATIELVANSIPDVEAIKAQLEQRGVNVKLRQVSQNDNARVSARLVLQEKS